VKRFQIVENGLSGSVTCSLCSTLAESQAVIMMAFKAANNVSDRGGWCIIC